MSHISNRGIFNHEQFCAFLSNILNNLADTFKVNLASSLRSLKLNDALIFVTKIKQKSYTATLVQPETP